MITLSLFSTCLLLIMNLKTASINMIKSWRNTCTVVSLCVMTIMVVNSPKNHLQDPSHI